MYVSPPFNPIEKHHELLFERDRHHLHLPPSLGLPLAAMSSSSFLRSFISPTQLIHRPKPFQSSISPSKPQFLPSRSLLFSSPISFQPTPWPSSSPRVRALKGHHHQQQQQQDEEFDVSLLPPKLQEIVALFQSVPDSRAKYQQLLHYGSRLPPLDPRYKTDAHRVHGCVSQVWVRAFVDPDDPAAVRFEADSDAVITRGLAALLVIGLSGAPAPSIASVPPTFVKLLGIQQSLTPSRNNGFKNMLELMQRKALQLFEEKSEAGSVEDSELSGSDSGPKGGTLEEKTSVLGAGVSVKDASFTQVLGTNGTSSSPSYPVSEKEESFEERSDSGSDAVFVNSGDGSVGRAVRIEQRLKKVLSPVELAVEDVSYLHAGHAAVRGSGDGETHFNVRVVSKEFEGKSLVKRHRLIYELLQEELQSGLHAISIDAKTPSEV